MMTRSWDEDQSLKLWRHRGGNSGVRRTEASSLGEWREMARLTTGRQWSPVDPLETEHWHWDRLPAETLGSRSASDTVHYPPPTGQCVHQCRAETSPAPGRRLRSRSRPRQLPSAASARSEWAGGSCTLWTVSHTGELWAGRCGTFLTRYLHHWSWQHHQAAELLIQWVTAVW